MYQLTDWQITMLSRANDALLFLKRNPDEEECYDWLIDHDVRITGSEQYRTKIIIWAGLHVNRVLGKVIKD